MILQKDFKISFETFRTSEVKFIFFFFFLMRTANLVRDDLQAGNKGGGSRAKLH